MTQNKEIVCLLEDLIYELTKYEPDGNYIIHVKNVIEGLNRDSRLEDLTVIDILNKIIQEDTEDDKQ